MKRYSWGLLALALLTLPVLHAKAPGEPTATLTYTATNLRKGFAGRTIGTGTLTVTAVSEFCSQHPDEPADTIQTVTAEQPQATTRIPAEQPLIVQSIFSAAGRFCVLNDLAFRAKPGVHYRFTTAVDPDEGRCSLWVGRRTPNGSFRYLGYLQSLEQICHREPASR